MQHTAPPELVDAVQTNCHISDARHASDYSLCVYLLKMREYFRWEQGYPLGLSLDNREVGDWMVNRESLWESLEEADYLPLQIDGQDLAPFETRDVNQRLLENGLVYSGGIGHKGRPHFFLADLERRTSHDDYQILVAGREYARDLTAPPAMALGNTIFVRRESFRRMLWEKLEEWRWNKPDNAMGRAIAHYDFDNDLEGSLDAMTEDEVEMVVLHEIGEVMAGNLLGDRWHDLLTTLPRSRIALTARAIRDHLADGLSTLPHLLERETHASLHFYIANLSGIRKELFPSLIDAYEQWRATGDLSALHLANETGREHWLDIAGQMLELHRVHESGCQPHLEALIDQCHL